MDIFAVEAYTASWIEIFGAGTDGYGAARSKPIRLRGLKFPGGEPGKPDVRSKPIRLRGLKSVNTPLLNVRKESKPIRLRGLKLPYLKW